MLNWIVWTICIKMDLTLDNVQRLIYHKTTNQPTNQPTNPFSRLIHFFYYYYYFMTTFISSSYCSFLSQTCRLIHFMCPWCLGRCPWCNGYHCRIWTRWHKFKSWMRLIAFHIALIPSGKLWIQLFSLQLWVNSRADWVLQPWWGN